MDSDQPLSHFLLSGGFAGVVPLGLVLRLVLCFPARPLFGPLGFFTGGAVIFSFSASPGIFFMGCFPPPTFGLFCLALPSHSDRGFLDLRFLTFFLTAEFLC